MSTELAQLVNEIIVVGKTKELTQRDIAERAGINVVTLSRAKTAGDIKGSTLVAMAAAVGMHLALVPDNPLAEQIHKGEVFE